MMLTLKRFVVFIVLLLVIVVAETEPQTCDASDGSCQERQEDFGVEQIIDGARKTDTEKALDDMELYFRKLRQDSNTTSKMHEILDNCKNNHENCAFWAVLGECDNNPAYMKIECAAVCQTCDQLSVETRCPLDPNTPNAWGPGDLNKFFLNITTQTKYPATILSRPEYAEGDTEEAASYKLGPWVVILDDFLSADEAERLIQLGAEEGYERSSDVGKMKFDGTFEKNVNSGRTSSNAWCQFSCYNDTVAQNVVAKITELTNVPEVNSEYLQLLKYEPGQFYQTHHDYIEHQVDRQQGVRILTIFLYLNDVQEGGGTNFPKLDITVEPKRGRALVWPSVLDSDPNRKDPGTYHQALKVIEGVKYGANAWIHMRDFKTPNKNHCQ